ncbi:MAG: ImmA/IrrE family metallo-endopeptidase [Afipia sp.]
MARDYKVRILDRQAIAKYAMAWWSVATKVGHSFNICKFVIETLAQGLHGSKAGLRITFCSYEDLPEGACVTFNPLTLHIVEQIWRDASLGKFYARRIVAHEIGHIVLHDDTAVAFSNEKSAQLNFVEDQESCEWQANVFADYFLVPDHIAIRLGDTDLISALCVVTDDLASRCLREARSARFTLTPQYDGEMCSKCHNFTLVRNSGSTKCDTCGDRSSEFQRLPN